MNAPLRLICLLAGLATLAPVASAGGSDGTLAGVGHIVQGRTDPIAECVAPADGQPPCVFGAIQPCQREALGSVCLLVRAFHNWCTATENCEVQDPTYDRDHDLVPDSAESAWCGRPAARGADAQVPTPYTTCRSHSDMSGFVDNDHDGVPDDSERALCALEDENTDLDGSCSPDGLNWTI